MSYYNLDDNEENEKGGCGCTASVFALVVAVLLFCCGLAVAASLLGG
ncbi:MAG: hypothetical protein M5U34_42585 [Chloroflexi bacterium]|nr:hypothetical protein [Chloroflexota bacterium]